MSSENARAAPLLSGMTNGCWASLLVSPGHGSIGAQLLTSEGWQRWVRVRSQAGLARLSLSNQLLVALARPDATFVAGFKVWLSRGYCVKKNERDPDHRADARQAARSRHRRGQRRDPDPVQDRVRVRQRSGGALAEC
jgi:hypothetical protein